MYLKHPWLFFDLIFIVGYKNVRFFINRDNYFEYVCRYKCTLCKFTAYNRSECTTHLRKVHTAKTSGIRDMNPFIHDLEPEKQKQEQLSMLTRVERPGLERSNSGEIVSFV